MHVSLINLSLIRLFEIIGNKIYEREAERKI